ncbi:MAG TPA: PEP-CTERM sorting domain-containing protein [Nodularia sp. (in: cyanobacteria)]|nr:PEP-CTERM sorting domain-containing protein [Nodularia sp. (in: cyanobacteria)]
MTNNSTRTISKIVALSLATSAITLMSAHSASAATLEFDLDFTKLSGFINTGANTTEIGIFRADLSSFNDIISIALVDGYSGGSGGGSGEFSGFDLDSIRISTTLINNAADINTATPLNVFDFTNVSLTPGNQTEPIDPALFGTSGFTINNAVATLGTFDGFVFDTTPQQAGGFASLGFGGDATFFLTNPLPTGTPLYLYVGETGNNEMLNNKSFVSVQDVTTSVPEPTSLAALSLMGIYFAARRKQAVKTA